MLIFENDDFEVIRAETASKTLIITFSSLGMFDDKGSLADGKTFWGKGLIEKFSYSAIGFVAKRREWFCSPVMTPVCAEIAKLASHYDQVISYGSSMGGYAALRWASRLGAHAAVAFAPQYSIDPSLVSGFDKRYEYAFNATLHTRMGIKGSDVPSNGFLLYDPSCREDFHHARLIIRNAPHIVPVSLWSCGHECIRAFADSTRANRLLLACGDGDVPAVFDLARHARKASAIRPFELAFRLATAKTHLARRIADKYGGAFEVKQNQRLEERLSEADRSHTIRAALPLTTGNVSTPSGVASKLNSTILKVEVKKLSDKPVRLVHLHIPKTAGTAIRTSFEKQFSGQLRMFPHWDETKYFNIDPTEFDFYSGHIGFNTANRLEGKIVTVLRYPVDRFVSVYYFWRQLYETGVERSLNTELASKYSLDEFAKIRDQPGLIEEFDNRCTFQIAYGSSLSQRRELRLRGLSDDEIFGLASTNLASFSVVGIQEDISSFSARMVREFGVDLKVEKVNVTIERPDVAEISISTRRIIQERLYMDLELYQQALSLK